LREWIQYSLDDACDDPAMTQNTYRITEGYNEPMRRAIFYVWDNNRIVGVYQTRHDAEEYIKKSANDLITPFDQMA
jgi:hypothetical protein